MEWLIVLGNIASVGVLFAGIALCVYFDQNGKTRRRVLEHEERMRAIELGRPLEDAAVARYQALGAMGVAVPIASLSAAIMGSMLVWTVEHTGLRIGILGIVWGVCGVICVVTLPIVLARLRDRPAAIPWAPPTTRGGEGREVHSVAPEPPVVKQTGIREA